MRTISLKLAIDCEVFQSLENPGRCSFLHFYQFFDDTSERINDILVALNVVMQITREAKRSFFIDVF